MGPAAFLLDFFLVGKITQRTALRLVNPERENPFHLVKHAGAAFLPVWLQTTALNFPMAFFWQFFYAGPFVRFIFRHIFSSSSDQIPETQKEV